MQEISLYLPGVLLAYFAFLLAIMSPGPNILAVIGTSMGIGRATGMALAFGVATGSFTWAVLTVFGLSALLAAYASALLLNKIFGGFYLLWLAYKSFKSAMSRHDIEVTELAGRSRAPMGYFTRGYINQMTNPKAVLAWIAIISLGLKDDAPIWVGGAILAGTFILLITIHLMYAIAFSTPAMVRLCRKSRRTIQGVLGTFFTCAGLRLLADRT